MPLENVLIGLGTGMLPGVMDAITGTSAKRKRALDQQGRAVDESLMELQGEIGTNAATMPTYQLAEGLIEKRRARAIDALNRESATGGATSEASLGKLAVINEGVNEAEGKALEAAIQRREQLRALYRELTLKKAGLAVAEATAGSQAQAQFFQNFAQTVPMLFRGDQGYKPETGEKKEGE